MTHTQAYLEIAADGRCLAHVLDLPGCIVRAPSRAEALAQLPQAIRDHNDWLRQHGEPAPDAGTKCGGDSIQIDVVAEIDGRGPFDPGDPAALFAPDLAPLSPDELERHLRLMDHARADLLALVRDLSDTVLDWQWVPQVFTIRHTLRHVGNAEEWYVSRLVSPETLPAEWDGDENLPLLAFLEMERRTAVDRLRRLTEAERSEVFHPTRWTDHPEEAWTARKALRRALEHERQHTAQIRRALSAYRQTLLARLASERTELLAQLLYLDERTLTQEIVHGEWTAQDTLAHIAAWDGWQHRVMQQLVEGERPDLSALDELAASNAAFNAAQRDASLESLLDRLRAARNEWIDWLNGLPLEAFYQTRFYREQDWTFSGGAVQVMWDHDAHHAARIATWRKSRERQAKSGDKAVLRAALAAARQELLAAVATVPPELRSSRAVCGAWTLLDVIGHVADWEALGADGLAQMAAGRAPNVEHVTDIDVWNAAHVEARRGQSWEQVWKDVLQARRALGETLAKMSQADLEQTYPFPWGPDGTPYQWIVVYVDHDRSHARGLRVSIAQGH